MPGPPAHATGARPVPGRPATGSRPATARNEGPGGPYSSSLTLRRGRSANHQMLAMVAMTPKAAAGLAILRERSDMGPTLPGPTAGRARRRSAGPCPRSHVLLPIFFAFSYPLLGFPLRTTRTMGDMPGSTFRTSRTERLRRHADGLVLTVIQGSGGRSGTPSREPRPAHPGQEGFTPDGDRGDAPDSAVQASEPGPSPSRSTSRGSTSPDSDRMTSTGSGPIDHRGLVLDRIAEFLEAHAGDDSTAPSARLRQIR